MDKLKKEEKDAARLLIKNLSINFDPRNFENPTIQKFYSGLQALALGEDEPEQVEDLLEPDYEEFEKRKPVFDRFKNTFFDGQSSDAELSEPKSRGTGRGRGRGARGGYSRAASNESS